MHKCRKAGLLVCVAFSFFGLFSSKAQELPKPPVPPETNNSVELLDFAIREVSKGIQPGITTEQIEQFVAEMLKPTKAELYFKGYHGYPSISLFAILSG